jgi:hypothetical protein
MFPEGGGALSVELAVRDCLLKARCAGALVEGSIWTRQGTEELTVWNSQGQTSFGHSFETARHRIAALAVLPARRVSSSAELE